MTAFIRNPPTSNLGNTLRAELAGEEFNKLAGQSKTVRKAVTERMPDAVRLANGEVNEPATIFKQQRRADLQKSMAAATRWLFGPSGMVNLSASEAPLAMNFASPGSNANAIEGLSAIDASVHTPDPKHDQEAALRQIRALLGERKR